MRSQCSRSRTAIDVRLLKPCPPIRVLSAVETRHITDLSNRSAAPLPPYRTDPHPAVETRHQTQTRHQTHQNILQMIKAMFYLTWKWKFNSKEQCLHHVQHQECKKGPDDLKDSSELRRDRTLLTAVWTWPPPPLNSCWSWRGLDRNVYKIGAGRKQNQNGWGWFCIIICSIVILICEQFNSFVYLLKRKWHVMVCISFQRSIIQFMKYRTIQQLTLCSGSLSPFLLWWN